MVGVQSRPIKRTLLTWWRITEGCGHDWIVGRIADHLLNGFVVYGLPGSTWGTTDSNRIAKEISAKLRHRVAHTWRIEEKNVNGAGYSVQHSLWIVFELAE